MCNEAEMCGKLMEMYVKKEYDHDAMGVGNGYVAKLLE